MVSLGIVPPCVPGESDHPYRPFFFKNYGWELFRTKICTVKPLVENRMVPLPVPGIFGKSGNCNQLLYFKWEGGVSGVPLEKAF